MSSLANKPAVGFTQYSTPTDTQIVAVRVVEAPARLVFETYTQPRHLQKWLLGPEGWTMPICEIDPRVGGKWRYVWRKGDGSEMTMGGEIREVIPNRRLVSTESWGPEWPETINAIDFAEAGGQTTITLTMTYPSKQARDAALKTGMRDGMDQGYARLDRLLKTLA